MACRSDVEDQLALLQQIKDDAAKEQTVSIILIGKVGSGKTSLVSSIANQDMAKCDEGGYDGFEAGTNKVNCTSFPVGKVTVNVIDTCGMMDTSAAADNQDGRTLKMVKDIVKEDSKAVLIVCIGMYERIDRSTLEVLASLHQKLEPDASNDKKSEICRSNVEFWSRVVIALTKADMYQEHKWLMSDRRGLSKRLFISKTFAEKVENRRESLKKLFTATDSEAPPGCYIGMIAKEFDELNIPIIPTSQLDRHALDKMQQVGYGYWFDQLLIKCCQRLEGCGLLDLHAGRLLRLPHELVKAEIGAENFQKLQKKRSIIENVFILALIYIWYQKRQYYKNIITMDRFVQPKKK